MIRGLLGEQKGKTVECVGRGRGAKWIKRCLRAVALQRAGPEGEGFCLHAVA